MRRSIYLRWTKLRSCVQLLTLLNVLMQRRLRFRLLRGFDRVLHNVLRCRRRFSRCRCTRCCRSFRSTMHSSFRSSNGKHWSALLGYYRHLLRLDYAASILINADIWPNLGLLLLLLLRMRLPLSGHRHSRPRDLGRHRTLRRRLLRQNAWRLRHWRTRLKLIILIRRGNARI